MKQFFSVLFLFTFLWCSSILAQDNAQDLAPKSQGQAIINGHGGTPIWEAPDAVLFDQSDLVNDPGGGAGGADRSYIESALGHTLYGWGHQLLNDNSMADQFTIPAGEEWTIDEMITWAYQTNATTTSTITGVYVKIWDGPPSSGGTVIWGDFTTNLMINTEWSNIYRTNETDPTSTARAIMVQTSTIGTTLTEGTYWMNWETDGSLASGPWCPPVTQLGVAVTGDAEQGIAGVFAPALNGTEPNGAPFMLMGTVGGGGSDIIFEDNFDAYVAGQQLACQNPTDWTTWSDLPCDATEDPFVSDVQSSSPSNSVNIVASNDLLKLFPQLYTTGKYSMAFEMYVPTGQSGYFNCLSSWNSGSPVWAMQVYFYNDGTGNLDAGVALAQPFTYTPDSWMDVVVIADLDMDVGEFWLDGVMIYTWQWSLGTFGTGELSLEANNFFGRPAPDNDDYYFDNYVVTDISIVPVELTSFAGSVTNLGQVMLNWETATETNNQGFEIERRTESSEYRTVGFVEGYGTTTEQRSYSYLDQTVEQGVNFYRLKQVDFDGSFEYSDEIEVDVTGPLSFNLDQNYPNPFNPSTNINFSIPESGNVRLAVYNLVGEEVAVLVDGFRTAGFYEATFDASSLPSGVYLYKLQSANSVQTKKMMLLK